MGGHDRHPSGVRGPVPGNGPGRFVAVGLMVVGIALLGVVTATLAAWFVARIQDVQAAETAPRPRCPMRTEPREVNLR